MKPKQNWTILPKSIIAISAEQYIPSATIFLLL